MKNTKKGFTLVELLVVIAIVAILATVAIIGYTSFTKKAEISADQQAVVQMNKALIDLPADADVDDVIAALIANKYNGDLTTYYNGYSLAWLASDKSIVLVENNAIVYPENLAGKTGFVALNPLATDADSLTSGLANGKVHMNSNVSAEGLTPEATGDYEVVLNGNTLGTTDLVGAWVEGTKLVVSNGVIDGSAIADDDVVVYASRGGSVELNNVQVYAPAGYNPIQCYGGTMVLNNVTTSQTGEGHASWYNSAIQVINTIKQEEGREKVWTIYGQQANLTIDGGMYTGEKAIQISAPGGNVTINGGTFVGTQYVIQNDFAPQNYNDGDNYESVITINGGNFTGAIKVSAKATLVINGGTFSVDPSAWVNAETHTVTLTNGLYTVAAK